MQGIYIVANDKVKENTIALLNSIRYFDPEIPIFLIPFDDHYEQVFSIISQKHQVKLFPNLDFINQFTNNIANIFDRDFLALPNKMRKLVQWFGPLDQFLYIDTDILVFEKISQLLTYLDHYDFICCDYHYKGRKLADIFSPLVLEIELFTETELQDVFNSGFWGSKKGIFTEEKLYNLLRECSQHREYFDFSQKTTDQPILNYLILKSTTKRLNLVKLSDHEPGSWAGSPHFVEKDHILYDGEEKLKYLHWAGIPMKPGSPYRELWEYYRYLGEEKPPQAVINEPEISLFKQLKGKVKNWLKF